ncbi:MAG: rhodanese-like domain-containing protein [Anaerolineales bacterium]
MQRKGSWLFALTIILAMLLSACGSDAVPETNNETPAAVAEWSAAQNPSSPNLSYAAPENLDAAFNSFLDNMVDYNALNLADLNEMLADEPPPFLLDVRSIDEVAANGYIEGAVVIPVLELGMNLDLLPSFNTPIVAYCGSGWRCMIAMTALGPLGWTSTFVLKEGSYKGWAEAGYPVAHGIPESVVLNAASPDPAMTAVINRLLSNLPEDWGYVTASSILQEGEGNPGLIMIDVRSDDEVKVSGSIEGAIQIPLEDFIDRKADWPIDKDATIVIFCGFGHRSTIAMTILMTYGYSDVRSIGG